MSVTYGLTVTQDVGVSLNTLKSPKIAVIGTLGGNATASPNTLYEIKSSGDLNQFDTPSFQTAVEVLQNYGHGLIYAVGVVEGVDAAETETNIIGGLNGTTGDPEGLEIFKDINLSGGFILAPTFNTNPVIVKLLEVANVTYSVAIVDFTPTSTVNDVQTTRGTNTALGTKDERLIICFPHVLNSDSNVQPLSAHLLGVITETDRDVNYGVSPGNRKLKGVANADISYTTNLSNESADNHLVEREGVITIYGDGTDFYTWGNKNSLNESSNILSYINSIRVRDTITELIEKQNQKFLDKPSLLKWAKLLETGLNSILTTQPIKSGYAKFLPTESDLDNGLMVYEVGIVPYIPVNLIETNLIIFQITT